MKITVRIKFTHRSNLHYKKFIKLSTPAGFEPARAEPNSLAGCRLNHSAKVSLINIYSATGNRTPGICVTGRDVTNYTIAEYFIYCNQKQKINSNALLTGFEPATVGFEVQRAIQLRHKSLHVIFFILRIVFVYCVTQKKNIFIKWYRIRESNSCLPGESQLSWPTRLMRHIFFYFYCAPSGARTLDLRYIRPVRYQLRQWCKLYKMCVCVAQCGDRTHDLRIMRPTRCQLRQSCLFLLINTNEKFKAKLCVNLLYITK